LNSDNKNERSGSDHEDFEMKLMQIVRRVSGELKQRETLGANVKLGASFREEAGPSPFGYASYVLVPHLTRIK